MKNVDISVPLCGLSCKSNLIDGIVVGDVCRIIIKFMHCGCRADSVCARFVDEAAAFLSALIEKDRVVAHFGTEAYKVRP